MSIAVGLYRPAFPNFLPPRVVPDVEMKLRVSGGKLGTLTARLMSGWGCSFSTP